MDPQDRDGPVMTGAGMEGARQKILRGEGTGHNDTRGQHLRQTLFVSVPVCE